MNFADTLIVIFCGAAILTGGWLSGYGSGKRSAYKTAVKNLERGVADAFQLGLNTAEQSHRMKTLLDRETVSGSEGPVVKTRFRPRAEPNWHAVERAFDIPGAGQFDPVDPLMVIGGQGEPQKHDKRIVKITTVTPHLYRVDRFNPAYTRGPGMYNREPMEVPARWWPLPIGRYENGLFLTEEDARAAIGGTFTVAEFKAEDLNRGS